MFAIDDLRQTRFAQEMKAEGIEEGRQEGMREGIRESQKQFISRSLSRGLSLEDIAYLVDLGVEEVQQIVAKNKSPKNTFAQTITDRAA